MADNQLQVPEEYWSMARCFSTCNVVKDVQWYAVQGTQRCWVMKFSLYQNKKLGDHNFFAAALATSQEFL